ncbi:MAG: hypothetical protein J6X18_04735 [Bacteroidales bacterium]|nr:hypothetical protein [Bacteroidales bacterium]
MKVKNIMTLLDNFVYSVEEQNCEKTIHVDGYCYWDGESYQLVQGTFCYISLDDAKDADKVEEAFGEVKQYQCEVTEQEVLDYYNHQKLPITCVTEHTPYGIYC